LPKGYQTMFLSKQPRDYDAGKKRAMIGNKLTGVNYVKICSDCNQEYLKQFKLETWQKLNVYKNWS